jgi:hypothetical protein
MTMTTFSRYSRSALLGILILTSVRLSAQSAPASASRDTTAIELAAAAAARTFVQRNAVFDDRTTLAKDGASTRETSRARNLASRMGLAPAAVRSEVDCPVAQVETCRLVGDSSVYTLELPVITGDTAVLVLRHYFRLTIGRSKVGEDAREMILARRDGTWVFVRWGRTFTS